MQVLILGGGRQGKIIAKDLSKDYKVTVADIEKISLTGIKTKKIDCSNYKTLKKVMAKFDLAVGSLPSHLGMNAVSAAVDSNTNYVDLSFCSQDLRVFNKKALRKRLTIIHDAGIAPGISNMVAGMAIKHGAQDIDIFAGGVAKDREDDYIITWSPEDLYEEYKRPARVIINGEIRNIPALSNNQCIDTSTGLQGYVTDGLRSLLNKDKMVNNMSEYTFRWPGHAKRINDLLGDKNKFVAGIKNRYKENNDDKMVLKIVANNSPVTMVTMGDKNLSAMSKTTAYSCAAFVRLIIGGYGRIGVIPPEDIALDDKAYKFILDYLSGYGIGFDTKYPFIK